MNLSGVDILRLLVEQEEAMASLYSAYGKTMPEMKSFWTNLAIQEKAHASVLRSLGEWFKEEKLFLNPSRFNVMALQTNLAYLRKKTATAQAGDISPRQALAIARDIERSLIEKEFFKVITTDDKRMQDELNEIERHTREHANLIDRQLNNLTPEEQP